MTTLEGAHGVRRSGARVRLGMPSLRERSGVLKQP